MAKKTYRVTMSERCFRFKPDALGNHAPPIPSVYEFVTFNEARQPEVLFVGVASESLYASLGAHMTGKAKPTWDELFAAAKDVYFDYVASSDAAGPEDLGDIAAAFIAKNKPRLNSGPAPASGRWSEVEVLEAE